MSEPIREFTLTRLFDVPREVVFQAWTDPQHLGWFFSPIAEVKDPIEVDLRVGGAWRQTLVVDEDTRYVTGGVYREIVPPERIVFSWGATDGWPRIDPEHPEDAPVVTVAFNEVDGKTEMVFHLALPDHLSDDEARQWIERGIRRGWGDTIGRLAAQVAGPRPRPSDASSA